MINWKLYSLLSLYLIATSCQQEKDNGSVKMSCLETDTSIHYARRFAVSKGNDFHVIHVFGGINSGDTTQNLILYAGNKPELDLHNKEYIHVPVKNVIALSSIYANMICELNGVNALVGIESKDYYNNPEILQRVQSGLIKELQRGPEIDLESALSTKAEVLFKFGMGGASDKVDPRLRQSGIHSVICLDHLEDSPLGRAEWIKFFALFFNKQENASAIFNKVVSRYNELKKIASVFPNKPTVITELKFGDTWYVPAGNSYIANIIRDANGHYIFDSLRQTGSVPMSFETVYSLGSNADKWINVSMCNTRNEMLSQDKRYKDFIAYKNGEVYNNNLKKNQWGYSDYWESGMTHPDRILSDIIKILHPGSSDSLGSKMNYYLKLP